MGQTQQEAIQEQVNQIYKQYADDIRNKLKNDPNGDVLIVNGETHVQKDKIAHISALDAAIQEVGSENVVLSIEYPQNLIVQIEEILQANNGEIPPELAEAGVADLIAYAQERNITVVANDPIANELINEDSIDPQTGEITLDADKALELNSDRENTILGTSLLQAKDDNNSKVVVSVNGAGHLSKIKGHSDINIQSGSTERYNTSALEEAYNGNVYIIRRQEIFLKKMLLSMKELRLSATKKN